MSETANRATKLKALVSQLRVDDASCEVDYDPTDSGRYALVVREEFDHGDRYEINLYEEQEELGDAAEGCFHENQTVLFAKDLDTGEHFDAIITVQVEWKPNEEKSKS